MSQPGPGKLGRYPQGVNNPRQARAPHPGSQPQMMKQIPVPMQFARNPTPMGHQQQFSGSPVATHMFGGQVPQYAQSHYPQHGYYYTMPSQGAMYPTYAGPQYGGNMYGIANTMGQVPASTAPQLSVQQMPVPWQQHQGGGAAGGAQVLAHNPAVSQQQQPTPAPQKQPRSIITMRDPGTGKDLTEEVFTARTRAQASNRTDKPEAAEATPNGASQEEIEKQKRLEKKEKAIADFQRAITNAARKKDEAKEEAAQLKAATETAHQPEVADKEELAAPSQGDTPVTNDQQLINGSSQESPVSSQDHPMIEQEAPTVAEPVASETPISEPVISEPVLLESVEQEPVLSEPPVSAPVVAVEEVDSPPIITDAEPTTDTDLSQVEKPEVVEAAEPQPETSNAEPQPEASSAEPQPEASRTESQPEAISVVPVADGPAQEPEKEVQTNQLPADAVNSETNVPTSEEAAPSVECADTRVVEADEKIAEPVTADMQESGIERFEEEMASESAPFVQVPRKKKQKQRLKEMSAKGEREANGNMMDAFVDKPIEEPSPVVDEQPKEEPAVVPAPEDETWEEKEDFEVQQTRGKKKTVPPKAAEEIIDTEDTENVDPEGEEDMDDNSDDSLLKRQYSRAFLLQFAKNCTIKPDGLPEMDIVLKKPHCLTEPLNQDQRQAYVDFAPQYCRQQSGGRHSSSGRQKGGRSSNFAPPPQKKIIAVPVPAEVELHKTENKWVRPSEVKRDADEKTIEKEEVARKTRGILNKLTPQNFDTLLSQMKSLNIKTLELMKEVIEIIFEKAISEPNFSIAYAKMCQALSEVKVESSKKNVSFKSLLLNRCQREFMKEREAEQQILADRERKFDSAVEEKLWKETMELKEQKARRSAVGNVRFIGELYKLKMLRETIMHDCVKMMLDKKDEEYLEWLAKLLTTVGKDLSAGCMDKDGRPNEHNKTTMDRYFKDIELHSKDKKFSSRVRFMLQDLLELRANNWIPRREDNTPKTIDQLREDRKNQTKQQELASKMQDRASRSRGGRDSPAMKAGAPGGDGWVTSGRKGKAAPPQKVDTTKFKFIRTQQLSNSSTDVSLGPNRGGTSWAKGSSGFSTNMGNVPPPQESRGHNRYDILNNYEGGRDGPDSKERQWQGRRMPDHDKERASAIAASRELAGPPRSRSPAVRDQKTFEDRPKKPATPPVEEPIISDEKIEKSVQATVEEFLCNNDIKEAVQCIVEMKAPSKHHVVMTKIFIDAVDKRISECAKTGVLLDALLSGTVSTEALATGLQALLSQSSDIIVDVPHMWTMVGALLAPMVVSNKVPLNDLRKIAENSLDDKSSLGFCMAEILAAVVKNSSEKQAMELWTGSGIKWDSMLKNKESQQELLKKLKLEFTINPPVLFPSALFNSAGNNADKIMDWLKANVPPSSVPSPDIVQAICSSICKASLGDGNTFTKTPIDKYSQILLDYISPYEQCRWKLLLIAQQVADSFDYPQGLLRGIFETLYDCDIVEEGTIYEWSESSHATNRKNIAVADVKPFLEWMRSAEDQQEKDGSSNIKM